ncbi:MAG: hypothetical protein ABIN01_11975 [Ferruginibacter sp.]
MEIEQEASLYQHEMNMYGRCMREIKRRINVIAANLEQGTTPEKIMYDTEFICLQFRIIVELIALGNLAANQKLYQQGIRKIKKQWHPAEIIKILKKANPKFYPIPVEIQQIKGVDVEKITLHLIPIDSGYLTKEEFINLFNLCSDYLHGRNPFNEARNYDIRLLFPKWIQEIHLLITNHVITLVDSEISLLTTMYFEKGAPRELDIIYLRTEQVKIFKV